MFVGGVPVVRACTFVFRKGVVGGCARRLDKVHVIAFRDRILGDVMVISEESEADLVLVGGCC